MYTSDTLFDKLYPPRIQQLSGMHWTPVEIARRSAKFLAPGPGTRILDIGSGVGKFCLIGAHHFPSSSFCGIEKRKDLYCIALSAKLKTAARNVDFICGNFTQIDFSDFDHFYFYNSFYEHLADTGHIDQGIHYSTGRYFYYTQQLSKALDSKPSGTRLVTFHGLGYEVPSSYKIVEASVDLLLKMWVKK